MNNASIQGALNQYRQVGVQSGLADASPHRIIQMLMEGALERLSTARGCIGRGEFAEKGRHIGSAVAIIDGLRVSLDHQAGGEIAENLERLYDYMMKRLLEANMQNSATLLDEVSGLLQEIQGAWNAIPADLHYMSARQGA